MAFHGAIVPSQAPNQVRHFVACSALPVLSAHLASFAARPSSACDLLLFLASNGAPLGRTPSTDFPPSAHCSLATFADQHVFTTSGKC